MNSGVCIFTWDGKPKVEFFEATQYTGKVLPEVYPAMYEKFGEDISVCGIGMAAEHGYGNSGVVFNDMKNRPTRYAGRGGVGAVMAAKGLKFIVLNRTGAPGVPIVDKALFEEGRKKMISALRTHAITKPKGGLNTYGTAVLINILNEAGGLPTRNFSSGRFEGAPKIAGEAIFETNKNPLWVKKFTTTPAAQAVLFSVPIRFTIKMAKRSPRAWNMNRTGQWAPTAVSISWMISRK